MWNDNPTTFENYDNPDNKITKNSPLSFLLVIPRNHVVSCESLFG
ncbi:hypothetical protein C8N47_106217 [Mangrovibacterium marinum]|uniref:Uncharacterized protein n=1 Tax=Mangrovibacterium marinum TaxID=1639118 RepID=A0A2T5C322_9BACT|nr:hypothetical protein C8N47_106217 [Mangrovibacterium marinum]